jgi:hypothetical protein
MHVERVSAPFDVVEVLDRALDKGIVIDAWVSVSVVGIALLTVEARVVIASIPTYLGYAGSVLPSLMAGGLADGPLRVSGMTKR